MLTTFPKYYFSLEFPEMCVPDFQNNALWDTVEVMCKQSHCSMFAVLLFSETHPKSGCSDYVFDSDTICFIIT